MEASERATRVLHTLRPGAAGLPGVCTGRLRCWGFWTRWECPVVSAEAMCPPWCIPWTKLTLQDTSVSLEFTRIASMVLAFRNGSVFYKRFALLACRVLVFFIMSSPGHMQGLESGDLISVVGCHSLAAGPLSSCLTPRSLGFVTCGKRMTLGIPLLKWNEYFPHI